MKHINTHLKLRTFGLLLVAWMFTLSSVRGQNISNYAFTTTASGSLALDMNSNAIDMSTGTTQLVGADLDDASSTVTPIGFVFVFMGSGYNQFSANSNGILMLGTTAVSTTAYSTNSSTTASPRLAPMAGDLRTGAAGKVHYKVVGTAPYRTLVVEFLNMSLAYVATPGSNDGTYQARLYESTGIVEYTYGNMFKNSAAALSPAETFNIGIASGTTASTRMCVDTNNTTTLGTLVVNVYPLSANMAKVHSTANGSRTSYVFTPPSGASLPTPAGLSFSPVSTTTMSLNWTPPAPVPGYCNQLIYNSTDGVNYTYITTLSSTASTYAASGLIPNTTYYWKIYPTSEGTVGTSLDGSQATNPPMTYTWNVVSGSWATAGSWNPARTVTDVTDILQFNNTSVGMSQTATDVPTQTIARLIVDNGISATLQSTATATLTINSDGTPTDELSVTAGSALAVNSTAAALTLRYGGTGSTGTIAGTMEALSATGSTIVNTINLSAGTSSVTTVTGILSAGQTGGTGVPVITASATSLIISSTGVYNHRFTTSTGTIPTATWQTGSTCNITGYTTQSSQPGGITQTFSNFTWNCAAQTSNLSLAGNVPTVSGTFTVASTGTGQLRVAAATSPAFTVNNFSQTGGVFELNTGAGSAVLNVSGSFTHAAGSFCSVASAGTPVINFNGTTGTQNVSFFNAAPTAGITYRISNGMGINLSGTGTLVSSFAINSGGGIRVSTKAAVPVNTILALSYNVTGTTLTYDTTASYAMTAVEFPATNGPANLTINVGSGNVLTMPAAFVSRSLSPTGASGVLTMTSGDLDINSNALTLGTSAAFPGTLTYTAGGIRLTSGSFKRFFGTTGLPTTATATGGLFPVASGARNRSANVYFSTATALSTGGSVTITHDGTPGITTTAVTDGAYSIASRTNGSWTFTHSGLVATGTISMRLTGGNMFATDSIAKIRIMQTAAAAGTHATGTGTTPNFQANRTGLSVADLAQTHYIGAASTDIGSISQAIVSGNWNTPATWDLGVVPSCGSIVFIGPGYNVTVNSAANQSKNLTVQTGGTLTVASGDLTVGCTANNTPLSVSGTLTVTGGTLAINGNLALVSGGVFNQSGGNINVDGNAGGAIAGSVASGTPIVSLAVANAASVNLTGGTLTIVDPHASATASEALNLNGTFVGPVNATLPHTIRLGDGVSTDAGGNSTNGLRINTWAGNAGLPLGNVIAEGPAGTNRHVTSTYNLVINGDLTINNGAEFRVDIALVNGNVLVNTGGIFTSTNSLSFTNSTFLTSSTLGITQSTNAQTFTNNGTVRNLAVAPTANLTSLNINNTNATGVTFNSPASLSGTLTLSKGKVNTTATNIVQLGTATASGTLAGGSDSAYFTGPFARTFASSRTATGTYTVATLYPVGKGSTYLPVWVDPTTNSGGAAVISGEAFSTNSGTMGGAVTSLSAKRWEALITNGAANFTSTNIQLADGATMLSTSKILQATSGAGVYNGIIPAISYTAGTPNTIRTTGSQILAANFSGYFAYGDLVSCTAPADQPTSLTTSLMTSTSFTGSFTAAASNPSNYIVVRYLTGATPTNPVDYSTYTAGTAMGAGTVTAITTLPTFNQTGLSAGTTYDYYIYSFNNSGCFGPVYNTSGPLVATVSTCASAVPAPTTASAVNISTSGLTARWTRSASPSVTYEIDLSTSSTFASYVGIYQSFNVGTDSFYVFTGLNPGSIYYYRVRAISAGCYSQLSGTTSASTPCVSASVPTAIEGFEGAAVPVCWSTAMISGTASWGSTTSNDGVPSARTGAQFMGKVWTNSDAIISSMPIDMTSSATGAKVNVWIYRNTVNAASDRIRFHVNTVPNLTGATQLLEIFPLITVAPTVAVEGWYNYTAIIPTSYNSNTTVFVIAQGTTSAGINSYGVGFDDFTIEALPSCAAPFPVTVSAVTSAAATLNWVAPAIVPSNGYEYYISTSNTPPVAGTTPSASSLTGTSTAITGLAGNTDYYLWMRSDCGTGTLSSWSTSPVTFTTSVASLPYTQNFEGTGNGGWSVYTEPTYINNWVLGTPAKTYLSGAHSGTKAWMTNLSGTYDNNVLSSLVSPQFDFSTLVADPVLRFYHKFVTEQTYDAMVVEISVNGGAWTRLNSAVGTGSNYNTPTSYAWYTTPSANGPITNAKFSSIASGSGTDILYSSASSGWIQSATLLTGAAGQSDVRFRFKFGTDGSGQYEGWAIDDIEVVDVTTPAVAASAVVLSNITNTTTNVAWTNGDGNGRLVVARLSFIAPVLPTDNKLYAASAAFGMADSTGPGNYIVYSGPSSPVTVTGLALLTDYTYDVYEYNGKYMHIKFTFPVSSNASTLPVKLTAFTAAARSNDALVSWTTASEINNKGFDVERSADGHTFVKAGFVKGAGNSNTILNYNFTDAGAFTAANSNVLYYRLKQLDADGRYTYSAVVRVNKNAEAMNALSIHPNPFANSYRVSFDAVNAGTVNLKMVDLQGKVVAEQTSDTLKGLNEISFDNLHGLQAGIYFVKITVDGETQVLKLVKN